MKMRIDGFIGWANTGTFEPPAYVHTDKLINLVI